MSPETKLKVMGHYHLNDREFKVEVMKKLNKIQENSESQFNELRNKIT